MTRYQLQHASMHLSMQQTMQFQTHVGGYLMLPVWVQAICICCLQNKRVKLHPVDDLDQKIWMIYRSIDQKWQQTRTPATMAPLYFAHVQNITWLLPHVQVPSLPGHLGHMNLVTTPTNALLQFSTADTHTACRMQQAQAVQLRFDYHP
jgi:hypothetical protein